MRDGPPCWGTQQGWGSARMQGWETRVLLKHHLEQGVLTAELSRRFGVSRATVHEWIKKGRLDRDLAAGGSLHCC